MRDDHNCTAETPASERKKRQPRTPFDDIHNPEVRAHALIDYAFGLVDERAQERLAWSIAHKYGPEKANGESHG